MAGSVGERILTRNGPEPLRVFRPGERQQAEPRRFVIGGLLGQGDAMLLIGAPKSGKRAVAVNASVCVAAGELFFGQRTGLGAVIYVPVERFAETGVRLEMAVAVSRTCRSAWCGSSLSAMVAMSTGSPPR